MKTIRYWPDPSIRAIPRGWRYFGPLIRADGSPANHARYSCLIVKVS